MQKAHEERPRIEGKPPQVRFVTEAEQREWERQYAKTPERYSGEPARVTGELA
jgi:hypothetical protein